MATPDPDREQTLAVKLYLPASLVRRVEPLRAKIIKGSRVKASVIYRAALAEGLDALESGDMPAAVKVSA